MKATVSPEVRAYLESILPEFFTRRQLETLTHGMWTLSYMTKLDAAGKGPKQNGVYHVGKAVAYKKAEFMDWLRERYGGHSDGNDDNGTGEGICEGSNGTFGTGEKG